MATLAHPTRMCEHHVYMYGLVQELGNSEDEYAVGVIRSDPTSLNPELTVGHMPGNFQDYFGIYFLQNDGEISLWPV